MPAHKSTVFYKCVVCGKLFHRNPSKVRKGGGRFCSKKCFAKKRFAIPLKVRFDAIPKTITESGCNLWGGGKDYDGYGITGERGKILKAHRVAYEFARGAIPVGMCVLHNCPGGDNPSCVNPNHLWLGTNVDNQADKIAKGRQAVGERAGGAKLTSTEIEEIRRRWSAAGPHKPGPQPKGPSRLTYQMLAEEFGVSGSAIGRIVCGKTWFRAVDYYQVPSGEEFPPKAADKAGA